MTSAASEAMASLRAARRATSLSRRWSLRERPRCSSSLRVRVRVCGVCVCVCACARVCVEGGYVQTTDMHRC